MSKRVLLLGRKPFDQDKTKMDLGIDNIDLLFATNISDVMQVFSQEKVDMVIMGAGISLADRLSIIDYIFTESDVTSVHMKDRESGPSGMIPFVAGILAAHRD